MKNDPGSEKDKIIKEAMALLKAVYEQYKDNGMLAIYFWGSITRDDFDPEVSDIDSIAIIDKRMDLNKRKEIRSWLESQLAHERKFGLQFYGLEELNGAEPYTLLGGIQPPGYILLLFRTWIHVAGKRYDRSDFKSQDMSPQEAINHQLAQVRLNIGIFEGRSPQDPRRNGIKSVYEDILKGSLGALYWHSVLSGNSEVLNYRNLPNKLEGELHELAMHLLALRAKKEINDEDIRHLLPEIKKLLKLQQ